MARYIWDRDTQRWVEPGEWHREKRAALTVISDMEPYRNMIDGQLISGRRQHREFLRHYGVVEVGNEIPTPRPTPMESPRQDILKVLRGQG
ncbi:MAG: hypothetical protein HQL56_15540 [Magnetococcales bacterium]|nr:hypothetical protein [Magnetococcales bacterium]